MAKVRADLQSDCLSPANCIKTNYPAFDTDDVADDGMVTWQHGLHFVEGMNDNADPFLATYADCNAGLTNWRLPNIKDL